MSDRVDASRWAEIEALFTEALQLPPDAREAWLERMSDATLRAEVMSLLSHQASGGVIETAIGRAAERWLAVSDAASAAAPMPGHRFGPYEVVGVIGQGGMGAVYRARRVDGQFEQDVAIKLIRHGFVTPAALDRFRQERQFLARLTHPAIARLLDGGTEVDEQGAETPYLVMEHVDGEPITSYCTRRAMPLADRIRLFRQVCDAIGYAHEQLIVHRDLKPANILVTRDGHPKLLDFGIAKLLDDESAGARTSTGMPLLTPDYASPEQVLGERVTAATDVYSLGALLYELLSGQKAHRFRTLSPVELGRVVCETTPVRPSAAIDRSTPAAAKLQRQLEGDLDTIVMRALHKDPARRYRSVERLSEDLRRHLDGLPVLARSDALGYRAAKFVRRNRVAMIAGAVVVASLVAGTLVSTWQARRAERRFEQVRTLANALIYDVHDAIRDLPGSTRARQQIVLTALGYLNALASESFGDPRLQRDLAIAYMRIGDVQGGVLDSNLGDVSGALESYRRARDLLEHETAADRPRHVANIDVKIGNALSYHGDLSGALAAYARAQAVLEPIVIRPGASADDLEQLATVFQSIARVQGLQRDSVNSLASSERVLALRRNLHAIDPSNPLWVDALAGTEAEVSMALQRLARPAEALPHARESVALRERLATEQPESVAPKRRLILSLSHVADILGNPTMPSLGDAAGAIAIYRQMTAVAEQILSADASDQRAKWDLANCLLRLGSALLATAAREEGIVRLEASAALMHDIAAAEPANNRVRVSQAFVFRRIGDALAQLGDGASAIERYTQAITVSEAVIAADPSEGSINQTLANAFGARGLTRAMTGDAAGAHADGRRGVEVAEQARRAQSGNPRTMAALAAAYAAMGRIQFALGVPSPTSEACDWFDRSLQVYRKAVDMSPLDAQTAADMEAVVRDARACFR